MTKRTRAAEIWAALERRLIERCGLPNGHMLDVNRPYLIRWIGERLKATPVETTLRLDDSQPPPRTVTVKVREHWHNAKHFDGDTAQDPKLAAMLERSCSRRMGYDGDDTVGYE